MLCTIELTEREQEIYDEVMGKIDKTAAYLVSLPHEERLDWLKKHQYCYPVSFEREISGTVYTVNTHFSGNATETVEGKTLRILSQNISR